MSSSRRSTTALHELYGTGFNNMTMPLIRYQCGDLVRLAPADQRCACGRHFRMVQEIIGRADDAIKLPDGRRIAACLAGNVFRGVPGILQGQIRQDQRDRLDLYVVPTPGYSIESVTRLRANARTAHRPGDVHRRAYCRRTAADRAWQVQGSGLHHLIP